MAVMDDVNLDASAVQGNDALYQNQTRDQITDEIQAILDEAADVDADEDGEYGPDKCGDELPAELREHEDRLDRLREAKQRLDGEEHS